MNQRKTLSLIVLTLILGLSAGSLIAQDQQAQHIFRPMASPRAEVAQRIGMTDIEVVYRRPAVKERDVWGQVIPSGGTAVWRTGANENTTVSFSTEVAVQGQTLPAGTYGLHSIPGQPADSGEWTIIFSNDSDAWGSYAYKEENDALRVSVQPKKAPHKERFEISFDDLEDDSANMTLRWAEVAVPIQVTIDLEETVMASFRQQLTGLSQFFWQGWNQAAQYNLTHDVNLEEAIEWADRSIGIEENFSNLSTKAQLLTKKGDAAQANEIMAKAMGMGKPAEIYRYARQLINQDRKKEALEAFQKNAEMHPDPWFVYLGLAHGHSALGEFDKAVASAKTAQEKAPDNRKPFLQGLIDQLGNGVDINQ